MRMRQFARLFQVIRRLLDSDVKPTIGEINYCSILDIINFSAYTLFVKDVDMNKLFRILWRVRNATSSKNFSVLTKDSLGWEIAQVYLLPNT